MRSILEVIKDITDVYKHVSGKDNSVVERTVYHKIPLPRSASETVEQLRVQGEKIQAEIQKEYEAQFISRTPWSRYIAIATFATLAAITLTYHFLAKNYDSNEISNKQKNEIVEKQQKIINKTNYENSGEDKVMGPLSLEELDRLDNYNPYDKFPALDSIENEPFSNERVHILPNTNSKTKSSLKPYGPGF